MISQSLCVMSCSLMSEQRLRAVSACRCFPKIEIREDDVFFLSKQTRLLLRNSEFKLHHSASLCVIALKRKMLH